MRKVYRMKDQIELFDQRGRTGIKELSLLYILVAILLMVNFLGIVRYSGDELANIRLYAIIISLVLFLVFFNIFMRQVRIWRLARDKEKFTSTELRRIEREAIKGPEMQNVLVTHDVIAYHAWTCTHLIPVKDIVWMKEIQLMLILHPASLKNILMIVTRDKRIHFISIDGMDKNSYRYLLQVVKEIRPGVIIEKITDLASPPKRNFVEKIAKVDAAGTKDPGNLEMLYDRKNLYAAWPSEVIDNRRIEKVLILSTFIMYLIAYPLYRYSYYFIRHSDPIKQELLNRIWRTFGVGFFVTVPFIAFIIYFLRYIIADQKRHLSTVSKITYTFFGIIPMGVFISVALILSEDINGSGAIREWKQYEAGTLDTEAFMKSITSAYSEEGDSWKYEDITYPKQREVYGYDKLTKKEQKVFDLLYSEIMADETIYFDLPEKLSYSSFKKVIDLYECNRKFDSFQYYKYMEYSVGNIDQARAERLVGGWVRMYGHQYRREVEEIAAMIPAELDDPQKLNWIADYLLENVEVYQIQDSEEIGEIDETDDKEMDSEKLLATGYGAVSLHSATEKGYMEAFGLIAEKAGIYTIAAMDDESHHYWNLVQVDGQWKAINLYKMDQYPDQKESYYMVDNGEMEKLLDAKGTYGRCEWIELP